MSAFVFKIQRFGVTSNIISKGNNVSATGTNYADSIYTSGVNATIKAKSGDDTINVWSSGNVFVFADAGNDQIYISSLGSGAIVNGGGGNDKISLKSANNVIQFTKGGGKDTVYGYVASDKISLGANDSYTTTTVGSNVLISLASGDAVTLIGAKDKTVNIFGGKLGNDTLMTVTNSTTSPVTIGAAVKNVDASKRTTAVKITGNALANSIVGGSKNDSLYGNAGNDIVSGGAGNDYLDGGAGNDTLNGDAGNDTLTGGNGNDVFIYSAGKDVIADYATGDKISLGAAISKSSVKGSDVIFTIGSGSLTVKNGKDKTLSLIDSAGKSFTTILPDTTPADPTNLIVTNSTKSPVTIGAAVKNVDASTRTTAVKITGNALANSIVGGSKNDSLYGNAGNDIVSGGAGNDYLDGGAGNDKISLSGANNVIQLTKGDGKDIVYGYVASDTISLGANDIYTTTTVGNNVLISLTSGDLVTLSGAKDETVNIFGGKEEATPQDVIKKFMAALDTTIQQGERALSEAIASCSNFTSYNQLLTQMLSDVNDAGSADNFLKNYCGINLDNADTGAITGSDAGGTTTKTATSIVPEDGSLVEFNSGDWFEVNGLTVGLGWIDSNGNSVPRTFEELSEYEIYLWRSSYTWWIKNGLDLIAESYGDNFSFSDKSSAVTKSLWLGFEQEGANGALAGTWGGPSYAQKSTNDLKLHINLYYYGTASGKDGSVENETNLDRTIAHELTHAVMRANIDYFDYLPAFIKEGMAELTHGIDDYRTDDIRTLAGNSTKLAQALVLDTNNVSVTGINNPSYAGGYIFLRYLAKQASTTSNVTNSSLSQASSSNQSSSANQVAALASAATDSSNKNSDAGSTSTSITNSNADSVSAEKSAATIIVTDSDENFVALGKNKSVDASERTLAVKITGSASSDSILGGAGADSLYGFSGNDWISGNAGDDKLYGNAGDDTLTGGRGDDSLWGNAGADTFIYGDGDGKDVIFGFDGSDMLEITGGFTAEVTDSQISFKVGTTIDAVILRDYTATTFNINGDDYEISDSKLVKK